jgi:hypothetical protein
LIAQLTSHQQQIISLRQALLQLLIDGWRRRPHLWLEQGRELGLRLCVNGILFRTLE